MPDNKLESLLEESTVGFRVLCREIKDAPRQIPRPSGSKVVNVKRS